MDTYGHLIKEKKYKAASRCTILSTRNVDVNKINQKVVHLLDVATERIYTGVDSAESNDNEEICEALLPEYLNSLAPNSLPPYKLRLRKYSISVYL